MKIEDIFRMKAEVPSVTGVELSDEDMALINKHTRQDLTKDDVYVYPVHMCDNEGDRDGEYFKREDLDSLAKMIEGRPFIQDHSWSADTQHSRIFKTEVVEVDGKKVESNTSIKGSKYHALKGWAYTTRPGNDALIGKIDSGILKEVSIGFRLKDLVCDICGNSFYDGDNCNHYPGQVYDNDGKEVKCYMNMKPKEAFEVSFVPIPAQPQAGVVKGVRLEKRNKELPVDKKHKKTTKTERSIFYANFEKGGRKSMEKLKGYIASAKKSKDDEISIPIEDLEKEISIYDGVVEKNQDLQGEVDKLKPKAEMGEQYIEDLKKECMRLGKMADGDSFNEETMEKVFEKCDVDELKNFESQYKATVDKKFPPQSQTKGHGLDNDAGEKSIDLEDYQA